MLEEKNQEVLSFLEKVSGKPLTLGAFITAIREGEEFTQIEMAEKLGVSKQYVCDLEHGRNTVSLRKAAEFASKLGYSEDQFVRLSVNTHPKPSKQYRNFCSS